MRLLCIMALLLLISGCAKKVPPSSYEISVAKAQAQQQINDPLAVMPDWYRAKLVPNYVSVKGSYEDNRWNPFKSDKQHYNAEPVVILSFFWASFFSSLVPLLVLWAVANRSTSSTLRLSGPIALAVIPSATHVIAIIITVIVMKLVILSFYDNDRYIPWHFCAFIGLFLMPTLIVGSMVYQIYKGNIDNILNTYNKRAKIRAEKKELNSIESQFRKEEFSSRFASISNYTNLLDDIETIDEKKHYQMILTMKQLKYTA